MSIQSLLKGRLNGGSYHYTPSFCQSIDWDSSDITQKEYELDPILGRKKLKFNKDENGETMQPLTFIGHYLRKCERTHCLAHGQLELSLDNEEEPENGSEKKEERDVIQYYGDKSKNVGLLSGLSLSSQMAARLSIDSIQGVDAETQKTLKRDIGNRMSIVEDWVLDEFKPHDIDILEELGEYLLRASKPKK